MSSKQYQYSGLDRAEMDRMDRFDDLLRMNLLKDENSNVETNTGNEANAGGNSGTTTAVSKGGNTEGTSATTQVSATTQISEKPKQYRVLKGDTLASLVQRFQVKEDDVIALNSTYFMLVPDKTLTANIVLDLPPSAVNVPELSAAVYEAEESANSDAEKEDQKPKLYVPIDESGKRSDIKIWTPLTPEQKEKYKWDDVKIEFSEKNTDVKSPNELDAWIRKNLRDGWQGGDPVPSLMKTRELKKGDKDKGPVFEAYSFAAAWKAAVDYPLPKNVGAWFYWQHKLSDKKGLYQLEYSSNEQWLNFQNNKDHPEQVDYDLLAEVSGQPGDKDLITTIRTKVWNDQLLSEEFLLLTTHAQTVMYMDKPDKLVNGVYTADTRLDLLDFKKTKSEKEAKEAADELALKTSGLPVEPNNPKNDMYRYKRDGVEYLVHRNKLLDLEKEAKLYYASDTLESYVTENFPPGDEMSARCFMVMSVSARMGILRAYLQEWWLNEEQEQIVNLVIKNTPSDQRNVVDVWLKTTKEGDNSLYTELKQSINDTAETKRSFFSATENLTVTKPGAQPKVDTDYINEVLSAVDNTQKQLEVPDMVDNMSEAQIKSLDSKQVSKLFGGCFAAYRRKGSEIKGVDRLVSIWGKGNQSMIRFLLTWNDMDWIVKLFDMLDQSPFNALRDDLFETIFATDAGFLQTVKLIAMDHTKTKRDWEVIFAATPKSVFIRMTTDEKFQIIKDLTLSKNTDDNDETTIIRVMNSASGGKLHTEDEINNEQDATKKAQYQSENITTLNERKELYDKITTWDPGLNQLMWSFQGYNETLMLQAVNSLNLNSTGIEAQKNSVKTADAWDKDDAIDAMAPEIFPTLDWDTREEYIRILLGRTKEEEKLNEKPFVIPGLIVYRPEDYTRVGRSDEESLLLLLNSCPSGQVTTMLSFLQKNHGSFYKSMQAAIDGDQFKQLHDTINSLALQKIEAEMKTTPETITDANGKVIANPDFVNPERLKEDMIEQGLNHPKVIPWQDPGILAQLFTGATSDQYGAKWITDDLIQVTYIETNAWEQVVAGGAATAVSALTAAPPKYFHPWELIGVKFLREDSDLQAQRGELRMMPAVYVFFIKNKQFHQQLMEAIDIATLAIGAGELTAALKAAELALSALTMAIADVVLPAGSLFMSSFKEKLPPDVREAWEEINQIVMAYQLLHGGIEMYKLAKTKVTKLLGLAKDLPADQAKALVDATSEVTGKIAMGEKLEVASLKELEDFESTIANKGVRLTDAERDNILLKIKERKAIISKDEEMLASVRQQQDAMKAANKTLPEKNLSKLPETVDVPVGTTPKKTVISFKPKEGGGLEMEMTITEEGKTTTHQLEVEVKDGELQYKMKGDKEMPPEVKNVTENNWVNERTSERMTPEEQSSLKTKSTGEGTGVKKEPKTETGTAENKPGGEKDPFIAAKIAEAQAKNVVTITGKDAERMLEEMGVNAMYVPGKGGQPGILVIGPNASKADIYEEMLHVAQHEKLGWKQLSREEILQMEIETQDEMIKWAKENDMPQETIDDYQATRDRWQKEKDKVSTGEVPKNIDTEVFFSYMKPQTVEKRAVDVFSKNISREDFIKAANAKLGKLNAGKFDDKLGELYDKMKGWPDSDIDDIKAYCRDNPTSEMSIDSMKSELNLNKKYNPDTHSFYTPGEKTPSIRANKTEVKPGDIKGKQLSPEEEAAFTKKKTENAEKLKNDAAERQKKLDEANKTTDEELRKKLRKDANDISYQSGERAADEYMSSLGATRKFPPPGEPFSSASREVDQIWELNGEYFVVEAKGGGSPLGVKRLTSGPRVGEYVQQGTREYLEQTLNEMIAAKGPGAAEAKKVLAAIKKEQGVKYLEIRQGFDANGNPLDIKVNQFNIFE